MDYLQDIREPDTIEWLRPYFDMVAKDHSKMWKAMNMVNDDPTGTCATMATDIDLLRSALERIIRRQREVMKALAAMEERAEVEADKLIGQALGLPSERRLDRKPFEDDMN